jgi:nucleolar protein 14
MIKRRQTLLVDMQRRHKVGGIIDKRFGEDDPTMTPEEKMLERFAREKQKSHKKSAMFDLEDDDTGGEGLTHMGKSLEFDDDFAEQDLDDSDSDMSVREMQRLKRVRAMTQNGTTPEDDAEGQPERKKTKKEVMEEVIAKSKLHKFERQAAKEDDADLRAELDKELSDIRHLLYSNVNNPKSRTAGDALSTIAGVERGTFDREFDLQVKKLAQDQRAKPADRTKTEEEKAEEESERLKTLEEKRQKRMRGESVSDSEGVGDDRQEDGDPQDEMDDNDDFGLGSGIKARGKTRPTATDLGFDDEDDFLIDDDLVASGSELSLDSEQDDDGDSDDDQMENGESDDDDFTKGLLNEEEARNPIFEADSLAKTEALQNGDEHGLPYTFPCPESLEDLQKIMKSYSHDRLPTIIQRIRALYHPKLSSKNKERLANFSMALVDLISLPWLPKESAPSSVLESVIRHIHSLAKMFPIEIAKQFRQHLEDMDKQRPLSLHTGDLILLTAIGTVFPTSDHFHQVVTPAMLAAARYLGQNVPRHLGDHATGIYLSILSLQYHQLSKRFVPELINFVSHTICAFAPIRPRKSIGNFPLHKSPPGFRIDTASKTKPRRLGFADCIQSDLNKTMEIELKIAILETSLQVVEQAADMWSSQSAFLETFGQVLDVLVHLNGSQCKQHMPAALSERAERLQTKLERMIAIAKLARQPLELHHHRPLAIKTYIPKFEDTFDPNKHYDPDRERAELAKLKAEHKKERKGAIRELRKDANFMARENLRVKKAKDEAYEKKYKRLVAEIQSEEGREANAYEREKSARKRARNR